MSAEACVVGVREGVEIWYNTLIFPVHIVATVFLLSKQRACPLLHIYLERDLPAELFKFRRGCRYYSETGG